MDRKDIDKSCIERLIVFDFDGTLMHTPLPTDENKALYKEKTGQDWISKGWWSKPETLDNDIFDIPLNEEVINEYHIERIKPNTMIVMLTGRIKKLSTHVEKLLSLNNIVFDEYHYNTGGSTLDYKIKTIERLLNECPKTKELHLFDDRLEHIPHFKNWGENLEGIKFKITVVESKQFN